MHPYDEIIEVGTTFRVCAGGFRIFPFDCMDGPGKFISNDTLAKLHPRLPAGIRMLTRLEEEYDGSTSSFKITTMLCLWSMEHRLTAFANNERRSVAFSSVKAIDIEQDNLVLRIEGSSYHEVFTPYDNEPFLLPYLRVTVCSVGRAYLDEQYPGWESRSLLAQDLGFCPSDIFNATVNKLDVQTSQTLPDNFDVSL